jgi:microcystin-dependent protein
MFCEGQLLPISENETLFQLIGTTYGGDGQSTFALPDLRGRIPMHQGNGYILAETGGVEEVTLTTGQIPSHSHSLIATNTPGTQSSPAGNRLAQSRNIVPYINEAPNGTFRGTAREGLLQRCVDEGYLHVHAQRWFDGHRVCACPL